MGEPVIQVDEFVKIQNVDGTYTYGKVLENMVTTVTWAEEPVMYNVCFRNLN